MHRCFIWLIGLITCLMPVGYKVEAQAHNPIIFSSLPYNKNIVMINTGTGNIADSDYLIVLQNKPADGPISTFFI